MKPLFKAVVTAAIIGCTFAASETEQKVLKGDDNPLNQSFKEFVEKELEKWHLPGVSVAVVDGDKTWAEGYGYATLPSTPAEPSTLYYTGSTTKAFTAAVLALMIESEDGDERKSTPLSALGWQTPLASILGEDFVLQDGDGWAAAHLTLEDALSHRTGFPRHDKALAQSYGPDHHPATVRDYARSLRHLPMVAEPRVAWRYCNYMYLVVSHAIETLTGGRWLGDTMRQWIWEPLGMQSTYFSLEEAERAPEHLASGYYWDYNYKGDDGNDGGRLREVPHMSLAGGSGAGGIVSNVLDYARWVRSLLREEGPIPKAGHAAVKTPRMVMPPATRKGYDAPLAYALGWMLSTYKGRRVCTHSGSMETFGTEVYFFPDLDYGVITMGNTQISSNIVGQLIAWKLVNDKLGVPEAERWDWAGSFNETLNQMLGAEDTALDELYPERADPPLPRALPIDDYLGTYYHPAYQNIELVQKQANGTDDDARRELKAVRDDFVWKMTFEFEHVSGEFWLVYAIPRGSGGIGTQFARAEFRVRATGKVEALEIEFFEEGSEGLIVFEKVV